MFRKQYKEDFDSITPDPDLVDNLAKKLKNNSGKKHPRILKPLIAAVVALCLLTGGTMLTQYLNPTFTMVAFADDNGGEKVNIEEKAKIVLPFGKISRGEKHSYLDEIGQRIYTYDVGFEQGRISVEGKNIASVTYACEQGEFLHYDSVMEKQMEEEGEIRVCEFTIPTEVIPAGSREDMGGAFERLWNEEGYFDNIKQQYFQDISTDISDYQVQFGQDSEQMKQGLWSVEILYKFENGYPFIQRGKEVTANSYEEYGAEPFDTHWSPWYAIDMVSEDKPINYADLPSENITITVHFTNGKTETKQLKLSFSSDGNLIAEVIGS